MARNGMNDLRDHLFAALERLNDDELTPEQLSTEVEKAQAISNLSNSVINSAKADAKLSAQAKLAALGLTGEEVAALTNN